VVMLSGAVKWWWWCSSSPGACGLAIETRSLRTSLRGSPAGSPKQARVDEEGGGEGMRGDAMPHDTQKTSSFASVEEASAAV
jgi:hypothetical protein